MRWCLKSPASRLFTHPFIREQIKENITTPHHWSLWGEFTAQRASNAENFSIWWRHYALEHGLSSPDGNAWGLHDRHPWLQINVDRFSSARTVWLTINALRPRQGGRHFPDDIFKWLFVNGNVWFFIKISLKFVPKVRINNIPALVQIMARCRSGYKPLSEPMMVSSMMHISVTPPHWGNEPMKTKLCDDI